VSAPARHKDTAFAARLGAGAIRERVMHFPSERRNIMRLVIALVLLAASSALAQSNQLPQGVPVPSTGPNPTGTNPLPAGPDLGVPQVMPPGTVPQGTVPQGTTPQTTPQTTTPGVTPQTTPGTTPGMQPGQGATPPQPVRP
jgi:hypothetical protein